MRRPLMLERLNPALKIVCLALTALVLYQIARLTLRKDPLEQLSFTTMPLPSSTPEIQPAKKETNSPPRQGTAKKEPELPPLVQTRVERITQSEIFAAVVRPLP